MSTKVWLRFCVASMLGLSLTNTGCTLPGGKTVSNPFAMKPAQPAPVGEIPEEAPSRLKNPGKLYLAYAKWQEQVGNVPEARESYQLALSENPKSVDAVVGIARLDQLSGRIPEAEKGFKKAHGMAPKDASVNQALGQFYISQKRTAEGLPFLEQAAELAPTDSGYRYQYAVALARSGNFQGSYPHFVKAVGEAEAHYNIGYILYEGGQHAAAEKQFQIALSKKPQLRQAQVMIAKLNGQPAPGTQIAQQPQQQAAPGTQTPHQSQQYPTQPQVQQVSNLPHQSLPTQPAHYQNHPQQGQIAVPANYQQQPQQYQQSVNTLGVQPAQQQFQQPQQWQPTTNPVEQWPHSQEQVSPQQNWQPRQ